MPSSFLPKTFKKNNAPTAFVVFGGTGDLAQTKLLPALLDLFIRGALPDSFVVIGLSRKPLSDAEYQAFMKESVYRKGHNHEETVVNDFCSHLRYVSGSFAEIESYEKIKTALQEFDDSIKQCTNKLFYLAVPPQYYEDIFEHLHSSQAMKLCDNVGSWSRLLVEKPFGRDLETAQVLEKKLCSLFADEQIYRIDHYLAKNAVENIISLRFANSIIADSWKKEQIESIAIKLFETKDVSNRGSFYDAIGTLRDVGQNHMLQIFALLTMAPSDIHNPQALRQARAKALENLLDQKLDEVVRGQYEGFSETTGVAPESQTETYFKLSFISKDELWKGVRVTLEAGKALNQQINEAVVTFRPIDTCHCGSSDEIHEHRNVLRIQFAPTQNMRLSMWVKKPGFDFVLEEKEFELANEESNDVNSPEAYERVLFDCITGDQTRFVSGAEVESSWRFITPILESFSELPLLKYKVGSTGPDTNL
ncbi:MAG: hypothetical protein RLZZ230_899 [Candidatus Parcubacteria bacterium]|jgi:glucose-6-phosphate 1-dehydrogenase